MLMSAQRYAFLFCRSCWGDKSTTSNNYTDRQTDIQSAREFHSHFITISGGWCLFLFNVQVLHIIFYYVSVVAE